MRYYVQHGAGLSELVTDALDADLVHTKLLFSDDSSLVFEASSRSASIADLPYVKNAFQVLGSVARGSVTGSADQLVKHIRKRSLLQNQRRGTPFRTMVHVDGQLVSLPRETRARLESVIADQTGGRFNARGGSGVEYWIVGRRDLDVIMFCLRLTAGSRKSGARGSLNSDLSNLLVKASSPGANDVFLDPFGGSGSIVAARIDTAYRSVAYADIRLAELRPQLPSRLLSASMVRILDEDALRLPSVPSGTVTSIVTDPPWGEYEDLDIPYDQFTERMMKNFDRVLECRDGRLVLLLSRNSAKVVAPLWGPSNLQIDNYIDILVNGHPATVLVGTRPQS